MPSGLGYELRASPNRWTPNVHLLSPGPRNGERPGVGAFDIYAYDLWGLGTFTGWCCGGNPQPRCAIAIDSSGAAGWNRRRERDQDTPGFPTMGDLLGAR